VPFNPMIRSEISKDFVKGQKPREIQLRLKAFGLAFCLLDYEKN
jgi:hypothetical protein